MRRFVKSFNTPPANAILRLAIVSLGPVVFNAAVLIVLFFVSIFAGPALSSCCTRFGSVMAATAHVLSVVGMIAFFEFLYFIEYVQPVRHSSRVLITASGSGTFRTPSSE